MSARTTGFTACSRLDAWKNRPAVVAHLLGRSCPRCDADATNAGAAILDGTVVDSILLLLLEAWLSKHVEDGRHARRQPR